MNRNSLVRIGRIGAEGIVIPRSGDNVFTTERRQRGGGTRHASSSAYEEEDVGRFREPDEDEADEEIVEAKRERELARWAEKEIVPGLRVRVLKGHPWNAEKLDSGQILLTPKRPAKLTRTGRGPSTGLVPVTSPGVVGALFRDTDSFTREVPDPIPSGRGVRW